MFQNIQAVYTIKIAFLVGQAINTAFRKGYFLGSTRQQFLSTGKFTLYRHSSQFFLNQPDNPGKGLLLSLFHHGGQGHSSFQSGLASIYRVYGQKLAHYQSGKTCSTAGIQNPPLHALYQRINVFKKGVFPTGRKVLQGNNLI